MVTPHRHAARTRSSGRPVRAVCSVVSVDGTGYGRGATVSARTESPLSRAMALGLRLGLITYWTSLSLRFGTRGFRRDAHARRRPRDRGRRDTHWLRTHTWAHAVREASGSCSRTRVPLARAGLPCCCAWHRDSLAAAERGHAQGAPLAAPRLAVLGGGAHSPDVAAREAAARGHVLVVVVIIVVVVVVVPVAVVVDQEVLLELLLLRAYARLLVKLKLGEDADVAIVGLRCLLRCLREDARGDARGQVRGLVDDLLHRVALLGWKDDLLLQGHARAVEVELCVGHALHLRVDVGELRDEEVEHEDHGDEHVDHEEEDQCLVALESLVVKLAEHHLEGGDSHVPDSSDTVPLRGEEDIESVCESNEDGGKDGDEDGELVEHLDDHIHQVAHALEHSHVLEEAHPHEEGGEGLGELEEVLVVGAVDPAELLEDVGGGEEDDDRVGEQLHGVPEVEGPVALREEVVHLAEPEEDRPKAQEEAHGEAQAVGVVHVHALLVRTDHCVHREREREDESLDGIHTGARAGVGPPLVLDELVEEGRAERTQVLTHHDFLKGAAPTNVLVPVPVIIGLLLLAVVLLVPGAEKEVAGLVLGAHARVVEPREVIDALLAHVVGRRLAAHAHEAALAEGDLGEVVGDLEVVGEHEVHGREQAWAGLQRVSSLGDEVAGHVQLAQHARLVERGDTLRVKGVGVGAEEDQHVGDALVVAEVSALHLVEE
mmetsp:Transcript_24329/g.65994  ORF Transcript_24329/g.65994 Transcript_24329/m.65994 type:complete len:716 (+) Transcript_24329:69-2216(+)